MLVLKNTLMELIDVIEEFYEGKYSKEVDKLKKLITEEKGEEKEYNPKPFDVVINEIEKKAHAEILVQGALKQNFSEFMKSLGERESNFYFINIIGGLLLDENIWNEITLLVEGKENTLISECHTLVTTNDIEDKSNDLDSIVGYRELLGVPIFGMITKCNDKKVYHCCYLDEDGEVSFFTPRNEDGNISMTNPKRKYDLDSNVLKMEILENIYGKGNVLNIEREIIFDSFTKLEEDCDDFVKDLIVNFKKTY
jgi:hypothetical protein